MNFDRELDARGLNCPLPILRAKKALGELASGQVLRIIATDPGSVKNCSPAPRTTRNSSSTSSASKHGRKVSAKVSACETAVERQGVHRFGGCLFFLNSNKKYKKII
jgi:tRNA 2-thiouridine synthesizing protein A